MEIVSFKPSEEYKDFADKAFEKERLFLLDKLLFANIEHIGGTSVPGLLTKGDLDINVRVVKENFVATICLLKEYYEINQPHNWNDNYASFKRDEDDIGIQVTIIDSPDDWFVKQRDMLLTHPELVEKLNLIKAKYEGKSMDAYREEKGAFFESIT